MKKSSQQLTALLLIVALASVLVWRPWADGRDERRQQRNQALLTAAARNRLGDVVSLLDEGADPDTQMPPMSFSQKAELYYLFYVSHRLKPPAGRRIEDLSPVWSVLEMAAMRGNADMVGTLLAKGAHVGYRDRRGDTALGWAERMKGVVMPTRMPTRWGPSQYPRTIALLKAAEVKKAPTPVPSPVGTREGSKSRKG
jgi:hypothetical protein